MSESDYYELIDQIESLEDSPTKVNLLEQAIRLADSLQDPDLSFDTRKDLINAATSCGMPDKAMPAFSWCLAHVDKNPDDYDDDEMLWEYKWMLAAIHHFPGVSLKRIVELEDDFERRLKKGGYSLRPFYDARSDRLFYPEHADEKAQYFELWKKSKRDHLADCKACEESSVAFHYFETEQPEKGLKKGFQILTKEISCRSVPHGIISRMLVPLVKEGRLEEAKALQTRGYRMISRNQAFLSNVANHIEYFVYVGDTSNALKLVSKHMTWALNTRELLDKLDYLVNGGLALRRAGPRPRKLKLPSDFPLLNAEGSYVPVELADWFDSEADALAQVFDKRNQNQHLKNWITKTRAEVLALP